MHEKTEYVSQVSEDSPICFLRFWPKQVYGSYSCVSYKKKSVVYIVLLLPPFSCCYLRRNTSDIVTPSLSLPFSEKKYLFASPICQLRGNTSDIATPPPLSLPFFEKKYFRYCRFSRRNTFASPACQLRGNISHIADTQTRTPAMFCPHVATVL